MVKCRICKCYERFCVRLGILRAYGSVSVSVDWFPVIMDTLQIYNAGGNSWVMSGLRNILDTQSLAYMGLYVALIAGQWFGGFTWWQYAGLLFFSIGMQVIHHNHVHLGIWRSNKLNRLTSLFISVTTAVPSAMMIGGHIKNHHVHQHGPEDHTRTYRFGGDHNHFPGYVLHPFQAFFTLIPIFWKDFLGGIPKRSRFSRQLALEVSLIFAAWILLAGMNWQNFLLFVLLPQLFGLHWLLGANYLQHAHCDDASDVNYARNFTGVVNWFWFNIGYHTAHHDHPGAHWSTLRKIHDENCEQVDSKLCCSSFVSYVLRTFFLSIVFDSCRSRSLKQVIST